MPHPLGVTATRAQQQQALSSVRGWGQAAVRCRPKRSPWLSDPVWEVPSPATFHPSHGPHWRWGRGPPGGHSHPHGSPAPQPRPLSRPHTLPGPDACVALSGSGHCRPAGRGHRSRGLEPPILPPRPGVQIRAPPQAGDKLLWPQFPRGPFTRLREAQGVVWAGVCRPRSSLNRPPPRCLASTPTHTALHCPSAG